MSIREPSSPACFQIYIGLRLIESLPSLSANESDPCCDIFAKRRHTFRCYNLKAVGINMKFWLIFMTNLVARRWRVTARPMTSREPPLVHVGSPFDTETSVVSDHFSASLRLRIRYTKVLPQNASKITNAKHGTILSNDGTS
jgi:hypothetical protein